MAVWELDDWIQEHLDCRWFLKRLSGNDTQATGGHQAGPYLPKQLLFELFPSLYLPSVENPRVEFRCAVDSHPAVLHLSAIWYNNRLKAGTRNETRVTGWGGSQSVLLDVESTGALTAFAFRGNGREGATECHVWVCSDAVEEDRLEEFTGPVAPGKGRTWPDLFSQTNPDADCWLPADRIPEGWLLEFPKGEEILRKVVKLRPDSTLDVDRRLLRRLDCEFRLFESVEEAIELPRIARGYQSMQEFLTHAQSTIQRRRSRAGNSLQMHLRHLFGEEQLTEGQDFTYNEISEENKRPDFLFPSVSAYQDASYPSSRLRMLAVKRTLKDRWRQVLNEADRIGTKHLFTVQEGVSENQFREMQAANVKLVVPKSRHTKFPQSVRPHLQTLESFLGDVRLLT